MTSPVDDVLAEAIDRVRHRGLPPRRHEVCSVCSDEADRIRAEVKRLTGEDLVVPMRRTRSDEER
jgi:hypothetical protein